MISYEGIFIIRHRDQKIQTPSNTYVCVWVCLSVCLYVSFCFLVWLRINHLELFNAKSYPCRRTIVVLYNCGDEGVHTFPEGINPKVNVKVRLGFELVCSDIIIQHISHYVTGTNPTCECVCASVYWSVICSADTDIELIFIRTFHQVGFDTSSF